MLPRAFVRPTAPSLVALVCPAVSAALLASLDDWFPFLAYGFFALVIQPRAIHPFHQPSRKQLTT